MNKVKPQEQVKRTNSDIIFEIEDKYGSGVMAFEFDTETHLIKRMQNCNHADTDVDYIFKSNNPLIRIQEDG